MASRSHLEKLAPMLRTNNARFHFRERRGQIYLPVAVFCLLPLCFPRFFSPHPLRNTLIFRDPCWQSRYMTTTVKWWQSFACKSDWWNNKKNMFFLSLHAVVQIVIMAVCSARHEALTRICLYPRLHLQYKLNPQAAIHHPVSLEIGDVIIQSEINNHGLLQQVSL